MTTTHRPGTRQFNEIIQGPDNEFIVECDARHDIDCDNLVELHDLRDSSVCIDCRLARTHKQVQDLQPGDRLHGGIYNHVLAVYVRNGTTLLILEDPRVQESNVITRRWGNGISFRIQEVS